MTPAKTSSPNARLRVLVPGLAAAAMASAVLASPLKRDEHVLLVPTPARNLADGRVELDIQAWVFEYEPRRGSVALFARYLDLDPDDLPPERRGLFEARTQLFRVDSERNKQLRIRIAGGIEVDLPRTRSDGRTGRRVTLDAGAPGTADWIELQVVAPGGDDRLFTGRAQRVPDEGLSVVSDIDDTIKHSSVRDRRELLLNTFARPFTAVPGMAARYRTLAAESGTRFHYVSASPLQLQPALLEFLDDAGYPAGSLHLREMTSWVSLLGAAPDSPSHKRGAVDRLLRDFPGRRFLLVGDSGEHDPEIYAGIAREHGSRIAGIAIRDVTGEPAGASRWQVVFEGLPEDLWTVFKDGGDWRATP